MRKSLLVALAAFATLPAIAQDTGNWVVRFRATDLRSSNGNDGQLVDTLKAVTPLPNPSVSIDNKWLPELDIAYFFTPNIAAELILTVPQKQKVFADFDGGQAEIGSFKHLPPTLLAQYHFTNIPVVRPYVGVGVNFTRISDVNITIPAGATRGGAAIPLDLSRNSFGLAGQVGADFPIGGGWLLNVDAKYVKISADVKAGGATVGNVRVDPWLLSVGFGKRF